MTITIGTLFALLVIFQLKHFIADYPLQTEYMLGKFKDKNLWILPLLAHVGVHGLFTFTITLIFSHWWLAFLLAFIDMLIHFVMDRLKAGPKYLGRYKALSGAEFYEIERKSRALTDEMEIFMNNPKIGHGDLLKAVHDRSEHLINSKKQKLHNKFFWIALGFDQLIHHLTDILVVYIIATH